MPEVRELRDVYGRQYRVGESDRELLGRPRTWITWLAAAAMLAAGVQQYGFGAIVPSLSRTPGWTFGGIVLALAVWAICQAGVAFPVAWLRERGLLPAPAAMAAGAVLCAAGLVTLGHATSLLTVFLGYSVLGGLGTGLVYATCVGAVLAWFPDRTGSRAGVVSGAFAFGSVPFVVLAAALPAARPVLLDVTAVVVFAVIAGCAALLRYPPRHWWPATPEPRTWALDRAHNRRPAVRHYRPAELFRCGTTLALYLVVVLAAAVLLFDLAYLATFTAARSGTGLAAAALALLAAATGGGRVLIGRLAGRLGRRRILRSALLAGGIAQFVLFYSGEHRHAVGLLLGVTLAGLGNGCCYTLLVGLVREYFGEVSVAQNFGILYSAKAVGAVVGAGLATLFVTAHAFTAAGVLSLAAAVLCGRLTQPGRPKSLLPAA
ncbi:Predicted arabinose efflux permease, MFS family [Amycolatopsis tolypomycina]|uniref:Predicted arabinose efflux permease, MFS family n=1 Tax=Amycolatopsis tolypomycina TaxID=208445 RepID=A0A1H4W148_9PSEU|nr:MFS transporter [Amycolatopsis tolypomycina]SEC86955.1 Predicted arabinose efflux permease, MFS family [Amycolatopsis tolypomycina]